MTMQLHPDLPAEGSPGREEGEGKEDEGEDEGEEVEGDLSLWTEESCGKTAQLLQLLFHTSGFLLIC